MELKDVQIQMEMDVRDSDDDFPNDPTQDFDMDGDG